jgi:two-component system, LytTR family, sensor histidine kinase AlgZ
MSPYWICQLVGWSLHGLVTAAVPTLYGGLRWAVVGRAVVGAILGILLTDQLRKHMLRNGWLRLPLHRLVPRLIATSLVIAAVMVLGVMPFLVRFIPPNRTGPISAVFVGQTAVIMVWSGIYLVVHYLRGLRVAEAEKWRLELAMRDTELRALRAQLNPHFLFNSLNSLRGLVTEDPARAQEAITGLAALLRFALQSSRTRTITLEQELEATRHYLELETLRFEARLRYHIDAEPRALDHPVPPMLVQTLVENAIKHGVARLPEGGMVRIEARKRSQDLSIRVTNTGTLHNTAESGGIGLANSLERLRLIFGERANLVLAASGSEEVTCDVLVPAPAVRTDS